MTGNQHRFVITLPDGTEYREFPSNQPTLTEKLVEDDTGAYYYEKEMSRLRYTKRTGEVYAALKALEDSADRCEECTVEYYVASGGQWVKKYTGVFTMNKCRFILDKCEVSFEPEEQSNYRCVKRQWDVPHDIMQVTGAITTFRQQDQVEYGGYTWQYEFAITDGQNFNEPTDPGYEPGQNDIVVVYNGNQYGIYWRFVATLECEAGAIPTLPDYVDVLENNCGEDGTYKIVLIEATNGDPVPSSLLSVTSANFIATTGTTSPGGNAYIIDSGELYSGEYLWFMPPFTEGTTYDNGRGLDDVLLYLAKKACSDIDQVVSNFFRINHQGDESLLPYPLYFQGMAIYQITDVIDPNATANATRGEMKLKDLLSDLRELFNVRWRIEMIGGDLSLRIEHVSYFTTSGNETHIISGHREYEYDSLDIPKRKVFSALFQRNTDFVGQDIVFTGGCVSEELEEKQLRLFTTDLNFVDQEPDAIAPDGFFLMHYDDDTVNWVKIEIGKLTGAQVANVALSWANLHHLCYRHDLEDAAVTINGESITPSSTVKQRKARIRITNDKLSFDTAAAITTALGTGVTDEVQTELHNMRATVQYRF